MTTDISDTLSITDEAIEAVRRDLNKPWRSYGWNQSASHDAIWHYALGLGDDNPLYWDDEYAIGSAVGKRVAPPTFLYSCDMAPVLPGKMMDGEEVGGVDKWLPGALGLWAGDRWVWHEQIELDEPIVAHQELWDVQERDGDFSGRSVAHVTKTTYTGRDDRLLAEVYRTIFRFERSALSDTKYLNIARATYTPEERQALREQQLLEPEQRRGAEPRFWDDVQIDDPLVTLVKGPLTITGLVSWLGGWGMNMCQSDRFGAQFLTQMPGAEVIHPAYGHADTLEGAHWDPDLANLGGFPLGYDFGCQRLAWLSHCVTDWMGDAGTLKELDGRLLRPNFLGDATRVSGRVTGKRLTDDGAGIVDCVVEARNQRDEVTAQATCAVQLPRNGG